MGNEHIGFFPKAARNIQFIMVAMDYIIKWVEAKTFTDITTTKVISFFYGRTSLVHLEFQKS
jgi:hypothetical protein